MRWYEKAIMVGLVSIVSIPFVAGVGLFTNREKYVLLSRKAQEIHNRTPEDWQFILFEVDSLRYGARGYNDFIPGYAWLSPKVRNIEKRIEERLTRDSKLLR